MSKGHGWNWKAKYLWHTWCMMRLYKPLHAALWGFCATILPLRHYCVKVLCWGHLCHTTSILVRITKGQTICRPYGTAEDIGICEGGRRGHLTKGTSKKNIDKWIGHINYQLREEVSDQSLPMLYTMTHRNNEECLSFSVYRKQTHNNQERCNTL